MNIRIASPQDVDTIVELYRDVVRGDSGLARAENEISREYVADFVGKSLASGLIIVAEHPEDEGRVVAEIHAYKPGLQVFDHVLSNLTIAVHPGFQGKKIGRTIFTIFQEEIALNRPDIGRVELMVRESNQRALRFYQKIGFTIEGRFEMRIRTPEKTYEADIAMSWQNPNFEFDS